MSGIYRSRLLKVKVTCWQVKVAAKTPQRQGRLFTDQGFSRLRSRADRSRTRRRFSRSKSHIYRSRSRRGFIKVKVTHLQVKVAAKSPQGQGHVLTGVSKTAQRPPRPTWEYSQAHWPRRWPPGRPTSSTMIWSTSTWPGHVTRTSSPPTVPVSGWRCSVTRCQLMTSTRSWTPIRCAALPIASSITGSSHTLVTACKNYCIFFLLRKTVTKWMHFYLARCRYISKITAEGHGWIYN